MKETSKNIATATDAASAEIEVTDHAGEEVLDSQLQTYARKVSMICALEAGGKVAPLDAYRRIKAEWKRLKSLKKEMFPKEKKP